MTGLSIVFTGLCALVTHGNQGPAQVVLVDARGVGEVGGMTLPAHAPTLMVGLRSLANAEASNPTRIVVGPPQGQGSARAEEQYGIWDLTGSEVRVRVQGAEAEDLHLYRPVTSTWPEPPKDVDNPDSWRDIRYVARMTAIAADGRVDPALARDGADEPTSLPRSAAARIHLTGGQLEAGLPSAEEFRSKVFEFRDATGKTLLRQALTDSFRWNLENATGAVVVEIIPSWGGPSRQLVFRPSAVPHRLFVSNLPAEADSHHAGLGHQGMTDGQAAALHFIAYYKLLRNEPADEPTPVVAPAARRGAGLTKTRFCTSVWIDQQ